MDGLEQLKTLGESLGYKDEDLQKFVKEQQAIMREDRRAARAKEKEDKEFQMSIEKAKLEKERLEQELKLKQMSHEHELELIEKKSKLKESGILKDEVELVKPRAPKIPAFEDGKDDMDSYLRRFERYAESQKWNKSLWATHLSTLLKGRALDVYALMPPDQSLDYLALKTALLKRYDLTEDGFKRKFRACRPEAGETFAQFSVRLGSYFQRWLEMSKTEKRFDDLYDLMLRDQFLHVCNRDLHLFLKERTPKSLVEMATLADQFREARFTSALSLVNKPNYQQHELVKQQVQPHPSKPRSDDNKPQEKNANFVSKSERRCYKCGKLGHIASECRPKGKVGSVLNNESNDDVTEVKETQVEGCSAFIAPLSDPIMSQARIDDSVTVLSSSCQSQRDSNMPISSGYVEGKFVSVLV
ncbi:hypothetical protein FSP39_014861 [Pinctada imbricata]|uniref:CCHC-type domain-containing protein n=1 Tax=Pinctada imbricata TaxID=66713 RepID=A0AA89BR79_PINIB|nr:hypothetical protein FSP39_014861 [Pinctada imbricata]